MTFSFGKHSCLLLGWFTGHNPSVHRIVRFPSLLLWYQGFTFLLHACILTYMLYSGRPSPSLLSPKSFRKVRRLLASFAPQENTEKRAQTVKMTKQYLRLFYTSIYKRTFTREVAFWVLWNTRELTQCFESAGLLSSFSNISKESKGKSTHNIFFTKEYKYLRSPDVTYLSLVGSWSLGMKFFNFLTLYSKNKFKHDGSMFFSFSKLDIG